MEEQRDPQPPNGGFKTKLLKHKPQPPRGHSRQAKNLKG